MAIHSGSQFGGPLSLATSFQPAAVSVNTLAGGEGEPTTMVLPAMAAGNWSAPRPLPSPLSSAVCLQPVAVLVNTNVGPGEPTTTVVPEMATELEFLSPRESCW
ncbi:MAG: hypothetical protein ACLPQS_08085 [Acidimicrobiales bacterium]